MTWQAIVGAIALLAGAYFAGGYFKTCKQCEQEHQTSVLKDFIEIGPLACEEQKPCQVCAPQVKCPAPLPAQACKQIYVVDWETGNVQIEIPPGENADKFLERDLKGSVWKKYP